jgi:hypothetical protein
MFIPGANIYPDSYGNHLCMREGFSNYPDAIGEDCFVKHEIRNRIETDIS